MGIRARVACHVLVPLTASALFFVVAATPVEVLGCRTRGLLALAVAGSSLLASLGSAVLALVVRIRGPHAAGIWWIVSSIVLAVPAVALLILA